MIIFFEHLFNDIIDLISTLPLFTSHIPVTAPSFMTVDGTILAWPLAAAGPTVQ
jgi:hypothetical protein